MQVHGGIIKISGHAYARVTINDGANEAFFGFENQGPLLIGNANADAQIRVQGTNDIFFQTGNTVKRLTIKGDTGNVGIGSDNPSEILTVHTASGNTKQVLSSHAGFSELDFTTASTLRADVFANSSEFTFTTRTAIPMVFRTNGTNERLRITSGGLVGINTDNPGTNHNLEILGNASAYATLNVKSQSLSHGSALELGAVDDDNYGSIYQFASGSGEGGRMRFTAGGVETMNLRGGKVGINEQAPLAPLHVENNNAHSSTYYLNTDAAILVQNKNSNASGKTVLKLEGPVGGGDCALVYGASSTNMIFADRQHERLRINSSGGVSIGNNPSVHADTIFHVEKSSGETNVKFEGNDTMGARLSLHNNKTTGSGLNNQINFCDAGGQSTSAIIGYNTDQTNNYGELAFATRSAQGTPPEERLRINSSGQALLGAGAIATTKVTQSGSLDLDSGGISLCIGGDENSSGRTNNTNKLNRVVTPHYTNAEQPMAMISGYSTSGANSITYGGGSGLTNAATQHIFYTAANTTTTTGTERMSINSAGIVKITGDSSGQLNLRRSTSTNQEAIFYYGSSSLEIETREATSIFLKTNQQPRVKIQANGRITMGEANFDASNDLHLKKANSGGDVAMRITNNSGTNSGTTASLYFTTSPTQNFNTAYIQAVRQGGKLNFGYSTNSPTVSFKVSTNQVGINTTEMGTNEYVTLRPTGNNVLDIAYKLNSSNDIRHKYYDSGGTNRGGFNFTEYSNSTNYPNLHDSFYWQTNPGSLRTVMRLTNQGILIQPYLPAFHWRKNNGQTYNTTWTVIGFADKIFDRGNDIQGSDLVGSSIFTAPVTGIYFFHADVNVVAYSGKYFYLAFYKNGSQYSRAMFNYEQKRKNHEIAMIIDCDQGDEIAARAYTNSGTITGDNDGKFFGYLIG